MGSIQKYIGKGKTSYNVRYDVYNDYGKRIQKRKSFDRFRDARDFLLKSEHNLREKSYIEPSKSSVSSYLNDWLESCKTLLAPNTYNGYKRNIFHICSIIGHMKLQNLSPLDIQTAYKELSAPAPKSNLSGTSLLYIHRTISRAFSQAEKMRIINKNPCYYVDAPKKNNYKASFFHPDEVKELIIKSKDSDIYIGIILAVTRGLRRGEILGLRWNNIDFKNRIIHIENNIYWENSKWRLTKTKSDKSNRSIPISPKLMDDLKKQKQLQNKYKEMFWDKYYKSEFVCTYKDGSLIHPGTFSNIFKRLLEKNSIRHIRFHDLRHTAASLMLKEGIPMKVVSDLLGHSSLSITADLYSHVFDDMKKEAAYVMDKFM